MAQETTHNQMRSFMVLAFGAVCISFAAIFVKLLGSGEMGPSSIAFWRTFLGAGILFAWSLAAGHGTRLPWAVKRWTVLAGFLFFLDLFAWHRSILLAGAGMSTILANTQVFATAVLSYFIFRERLTAGFFVAALSGIIGVVLLIGIGSDFDFTAGYLRGIFFGLLTGVFYAHYLVTLKVAGQREGRPASFITLMAWTSLFSAIFLGIASLLTERHEFMPPDWFSIFILFSLALVAQALGWWLISQSLPGMDAHKGGLALLLQPVLATVWGALFFAERLTALQIVGAGITLAAIYVGTIRRRPPAVPAD